MFESSLLALINRQLADATWAQARLAEHIGQTAAIHCGPLHCYFCVQNEVTLKPSAALDSPTVSLTLPANMVFDLMAGKTSEALAKVEIAGNARFAETLSFLLQHLRPDPGAMLTPVVGEVLAHRVDTGLRTLGQLSADAAHRVHEQVLTHAPQLALPRRDLATWQAELDDFASALNALEQRVQKLP